MHEKVHENNTHLYQYVKYPKDGKFPSFIVILLKFTIVPSDYWEDGSAKVGGKIPSSLSFQWFPALDLLNNINLDRTYFRKVTRKM